MVPRFAGAALAALIMSLTSFAAPAFAAGGPRDGAPDRVIVAFDRGADSGDRAEALRDAHATVASTLPSLGNTDAVTVADGTAASAIAKLEDADGVAWAEVDRRVRATMALPAGTEAIWQWGLSNVGQTLWASGTAGVDGDFTRAWDLSTGSAQAPIAVVDTGVDFTNGDLAANRVAGGKDFVSKDDDPSPAPPSATDPSATSHGTHVAGIAAASVGVSNSQDITGGAPNAGLMALRALDATGSGYISNIADAFAWAGSHGIRVVNASLSGTGPSQTMANAIAKYPNTLFVVAAGNDGIDEDATADSQRDYPCASALPNVVCVAAVDSQGAIAGFSNYGATLVDVGAPGVDIVSYVLGPKLQWWDGTSMATPFVAAAAELAIAKTPTVTAPQLRDAIIASARPLASLNGRTVSGGMIDAAALVARTAGLPVQAAPVAATVPASTTTTTTSTPATTPDAPVDEAPPAQDAPSTEPALRSPQLKLASVKRSGKRLRVTGTLARAWKGTVTVSVCAGRHCKRTHALVRQGRFAAKLSVARGKRVKVTVTAPATRGYRAVRVTRSARS